MSSDASEKKTPMIDAAFDLYESGDPGGAAGLCASLLDADKNNYGALYLLGSILGEQGNLPNAILYLKQAVALKPDKPLAHLNLAHVLNQSGCPHDALPAIESYIAIVQDNPEAHVLRAEIFSKLKKFEETARSCARAIELQADFAAAYNIRGSALKNLGRLDEAIVCYDRAITLKPDYAEAYSNRGNTLEDRMRIDEAIASYAKAIALKPNFAGAYRNRASAYNNLKRLAEAIVDYREALILDPTLEYLLGDYTHAMQKICDWSSFSDSCSKISDGILRGKKICSPFQSLSLPINSDVQGQAVLEFVRNEYPANPQRTKSILYGRHEKIHLGYFSADFHGHATAYLMAELFERHDRSKFELTAFSFGSDDGSVMRKRLMTAFDRFVDVRNRADQQVADLARTLEIDIAVDLKGHTQDHRVGIFARRIAPIQINYLGYPGTMGADFIDYIVADKVLIPEPRQAEYSEKIVYLPHSYQPNDTKRKIAITRYARVDCSLPEGQFVFCCFNNNYKITPDVFDCWMRILKRVPDSVFWLLADNRIAPENLRKEAQKRGVDPARLIFAARMPLAEHLARHRLADLFLDTLPYNAHTTASDALWAGLPVLTEIGETFAGRVAASLLTAIGLPELIAKSQAEYEALAVELATNSEKLSAIKDKLANNRSTTPLFDIERYTRDLEAAYEAMYERYQADLPPDTIYVEP
jgi:predicted O-linked N-acetylglucosamine transferase (SPINDLY family)